MEIQSINLGIIGCGNMAQALIKGCLIKNQTEATGVEIDALSLLSKSGVRAQQFADELDSELAIKAIVAQSLVDIVAQSDVLLLAVKPQQIESVLIELESIIAKLDGKKASDYLLISVAAGITLGALERPFTNEIRAVRVMPNTPSLVSAGAAGYSLGSTATSKDKLIVDSLLKSVGYAVEVEESLLDPLTAISGSGPAYVFRMLEAMMAAGESVGLSPELSKELSLHTFYGASLMALKSSDTPEELRIKVTSPNGTTAAALDSFNQSKIDEVFQAAITAAAKRAQELAQ